MRFRAPPPPIVAAALSGFVVGIIATVAVMGVNPSHTPAALGTATLPPSTPVSQAKLKIGVTRIVIRQLGLYYPNARVPRLEALQLLSAGPSSPQIAFAQPVSRYSSVYIKFRLNDHPLGKGWRLRAARADVFALLRALYTSQLPIYSVWLDGTFPLGVQGREHIVLTVYMDHGVAAQLPWKRWTRDDEARLWSLLPYRWVDPHFA